MNMIAAFIWLAAFIFFLVVEVATVTLVSVWFAGGALVAFIVNIAGCDNILIQIAVFVGVSLVLLVITRPLASRFINKNIVKTNMDELIGKRVKILERVDNVNDSGLARCNGVEWMVRSNDDNVIIEEGDMATIVEVSGVKLIVEK